VEELEQEAVVAMQRNEGALALATHQHMFVHQFVDGPAQGADADQHGLRDGRLVGQGLARAGSDRTRSRAAAAA
jgi:hypothetical protein